MTTILGILILLISLGLGTGGVWLIALDGSWYYLPAGLGLTIAGIQVARRRMSGAWWFAVVFVGTFLWTAWEAGLDYWRWIPRFGMIVMLALVRAAAALQPANAPAHGDWSAWGRSHAATRYSPLTEINRDNVGNLERAWVYRTGDLPEKRWGAETTPLKVGDMLYLCSARNVLIALDARSREERWRHDPQVADENIPYTAACRGVAYYVVPPTGTGDRTDANAPDEDAAVRAPSCSPRIIEGTLDGRLIAVDARTGEPCAGFGDNGEVDITRGMGRVLPGMVSITAPPTIVRGVVVTGHQVLDGQRRNAPSGV